MIVVERQLRSSVCDSLAILHEFFDATDLRERRCHRADAPCTDLLSVLSKAHTLAQAAAAYMHNNLEAFGSHTHPTLSKLHTLLGCEHISLARRSVDEHALQAILLQHLCISLDWFEINVTICIERCKRCVNKSYDFFHSLVYFNWLLNYYYLL